MLAKGMPDGKAMEDANQQGPLDGTAAKNANWCCTPDRRTLEGKMMEEWMLDDGEPMKRIAGNMSPDPLGALDNGVPIRSMADSNKGMMVECLDGGQLCQWTFSHRALGAYKYYGIDLPQ